MQDPPAIEWLRLVASFHSNGLRGFASDSVRIGHHELALVFRAGLEIQDRARETLRDGVVEVLAPTVNLFATDSDKGESLAPFRFTRGPKLNGDGSVAIVVAFDGPFKAEVEESGMFDVKVARSYCVLGFKGS